MSATQSSRLFSSLFDKIDPEQRVTVLHIGPALPETVAFFSDYRCRLFFVDLFSELPITEDENSHLTLTETFSDLLNTPDTIQFDICLFWDLFNFLDSKAICAFLQALRPHLHAGSQAHGFAVHNLRSPQSGQLYGINQRNTLNIRNREHPLPGYAPHTQGKLKTLLNCFTFDSSVLLPDSRLELRFSASL